MAIVVRTCSRQSGRFQSSNWVFTFSQSTHPPPHPPLPLPILTPAPPAWIAWAFESPKPSPSYRLPPTRPHLLIFPKQFYQLRTKRFYICTYLAITIHTTTVHQCQTTNLSKGAVRDSDSKKREESQGPY